VVEALADGRLAQVGINRAEALQLTPGENNCPPAGEGDE
jgi:hypothetical protein